MKAQITLAGVFRVGKVETHETYGTQANISEFGEPFPTSFMLSLPDGQTLPMGKDVRLAASCTCETFGSGAKRFTKFKVIEMKVQEVEVTVKDAKGQ